MDENRLIIPGELMGLNEFINIQRTHPQAGNQAKRKNTARCKHATLAAIKQGLTIPVPTTIRIIWYCKNRRKDPDNIAFAVKFILDGLVNAGALDNDGWDQVKRISHEFKVDSKNPRVEVLFLEVSP